MKPLLFVLSLPAAAACAALLQGPAAAADWKLISSCSYDTGKYGTEYRTDSVYIPLTLQRDSLTTDLSATVPYLRQSSTGRVRRVGGKPVLVSGGAAGPGGPGASGIGDIILRGAYALVRQDPGPFYLTLAAKVKLPTASAAKGLGTGETDKGAGLEFAREISGAWTLRVNGYFTIIGDPAGIEFNDLLSLDIGFSKPLNKYADMTILYETESALVDGNAAPRGISGLFSYSANGSFSIFASAALGISAGSPGVGLTAGCRQKF